MSTAVATRTDLPTQGRGQIADRHRVRSLTGHKLTPKQMKFVEAYIWNGGNATAAAVEAYNASDRATAAMIGSDNLRKPEVYGALKEMLKTISAPEAVLSKMSQLMHHAKREETQLDAAEDLAKINGMFIDKREVSTTVAVVQFGLPNHQKDQIIDITPRKLAKVSPD